MKKNKLFLIFVDICLVLIFLVLPLMKAYGEQESTSTPGAKPVVLKAVTFKPRNVETCLPFKLFVNRVNERGKGKLSINWLGGPEVIGVFDQAEAVRKGVVDIAFIFAAAYKGIVPGSEGLQLTRLMPLEERQRGLMISWLTYIRRPICIIWGMGSPQSQTSFSICSLTRKLRNLRI